MKNIVLEKKLILDSDANGNCKPVYCISTGKIYSSEKEAAKDIGVSPTHISLHITGKIKTIHHMKFCLVTDMTSHIMDIAKETEKYVAYAKERETLEATIRAELEQKYQEKIDRIKSLLN